MGIWQGVAFKLIGPLESRLLHPRLAVLFSCPADRTAWGRGLSSGRAWREIQETEEQLQNWWTVWLNHGCELRKLVFSVIVILLFEVVGHLSKLIADVLTELTDAWAVAVWGLPCAGKTVWCVRVLASCSRILYQLWKILAMISRQILAPTHPQWCPSPDFRLYTRKYRLVLSTNGSKPATKSRISSNE